MINSTVQLKMQSNRETEGSLYWKCFTQSEDRTWYVQIKTECAIEREGDMRLEMIATVNLRPSRAVQCLRGESD